MSSVFLKAHWKNLILANYEVPHTLLQPLLPEGTSLDLWQNKCLVSLVGFMFQHTRLRGVRIPFHSNFEEINLRFYVNKPDENGGQKRGVVFVKEIVPKPAIAVTARLFYNEPYEHLKMTHRLEEGEDFIQAGYGCYKNKWQTMQVKALNMPVGFKPSSEEEFITEHYWGYTRLRSGKTQEYGVEHPAWQMYPVTDYFCDFDFKTLYGNQFDFLSEAQPRSVFLAKGSDVIVRTGKRV